MKYYMRTHDLSSLKLFRWLRYPSTFPNNRHKVDAMARKYSFLGYKASMKGFVILEVVDQEIIISRNVKFFDLEFPYHDNSHVGVPTNTYFNSSLNQNIVECNADRHGPSSSKYTTLPELEHAS